MNKTSRLALIACLLVSAAALVTVSMFAGQPARAISPAARTDYAFAPGIRLVPLGPGQPDNFSRREAYKALWAGIYRRDDLGWMATAANDGSTSYPAGTVVGGLTGDFVSSTVAAPFAVARSFSLQPLRVAVLNSPLKDEFNQTVVWEEGNFEQLFRVYLWCPVLPDGSCTYFDTISPTTIANGGLVNYDVLILPAVRVGWGDDLAASLGADGLAQIQTFVSKGGFLYAQSDSAYVAESAGVVPTGTVDLNARVTKADNTGALTVALPDHPLTFSWLSNTMYVLNEPVFSATTGVSVVATYNDTTQPGSAALLAAPYGVGKVVLMNGHPSDSQAHYPQVLDALLWAGAQRAALRGTLSQEYSPLVAPDVIPAYESVPVAVTTTFRNLWDGALTDVIITETVSAGFTVEKFTVPGPTKIITDGEQTLIIWTLTQTLPGDAVFRYTVWTDPATLAKGSALVSTARADYVDPFDYGNWKHVQRNDLYVNAKMAARLNGDRDIELDVIYPLPAEGYYFDIAGTIENKEETDATNVVVTDIVALVSPLVDVADQTVIPHVLTDVNRGLTHTGEMIWVANSIFFYDTPVPGIYPLPTINGISATVGVMYGVSSTNAVYTYTGDFTTTPGFSNSITIPDAYSDVIRLVPGGIQLPALKLVYPLGTYQGYDYEDPAWRYGLFSQELFKRLVSFKSDPNTPGVIMDDDGGSVFTNLGGNPIPFIEYLSHGKLSIPQPDEMPRITYADIWGRPHSQELRTVFYDIVPFPPPEYHAVVNTTFDMHVDFDRSGGPKNDFVLEYPANKNLPADLHLYLKSHSNFDPTMPPLEKDETLISQGMFKGLGFSLAPSTGDWSSSWSSRHLQGVLTDTDLSAVIDTPAYNFLYFQQWLQSQRSEGIDITATLKTYDDAQAHREGVFKTNDGARFVYHQKAAGPSRYEVFDSHVQAVFGLSSDAQVTKKVAPVRVATYGDDVYHFIKVQDKWDPREFSYSPFIQSYGFGDLAATTYVGGRHRTELLWPRVAPGGHTQIRLEINNNSGVTLTNLVITPVVPPGITVMVRSVSETESIEPLFFDFPFLHATVVSDAWKTVWYYDVDVAPDIALTGRVYTVGFAVTANNLPTTFRVPDARIGVEGPDGHVSTVYGQATNLQLDDVLPSYMTLQDARLANAAEEAQLENLLATGQVITAQNVFAGLRDSIGVTTQTVSGGALVNFTLPDLGATNAAQWPWLDAGARSGTMYVVLKSRADINWSGTAIANYGPVLTYTDPFQQVYTATGNLQTVEAHGANVVATYTIKGITTTMDGVARDGIVPGVENAIAVDVSVSNLGDYIASTPRITVVVPSGVVVSQTSVVPVASAPGYVVFDLRNLAPGDSQPVSLLLDLASPAATAPWRLITRTDGFFVNRFTTVSGQTRDAPVAAQLAGPLDVGKARQRIYLPLVSRNALVAPDLIVQNLVVTNRSVQVVIKNQGNAPVNDEFWVDVYINPNPTPTHVNQVWWMLGEEGLVWGVKDAALPIQPGGVMTLTIGDRYYTSTLSHFSGPISNGTPVYAQVDAVNTKTTYGGVLEGHEILGGPYNNIAGPMYPVANLANTEPGEPVDAGDLSLTSPTWDVLPPRP